MTSNIRTGIIGYGLSGRVFHAPFIDVVEGYELTKISTANPERMALAKERYPTTEIVPGGKEIIEDPNIDLVLVTSPNTCLLYTSPCPNPTPPCFNQTHQRVPPIAMVTGISSEPDGSGEQSPFPKAIAVTYRQVQRFNSAATGTPSTCSC